MFDSALQRWKQIEDLFDEQIKTQLILDSLLNQTPENIYESIKNSSYLKENQYDRLSRKIISSFLCHPQIISKYQMLCHLLSNNLTQTKQKQDFTRTLKETLHVLSNSHIISSYSHYINYFLEGMDDNSIYNNHPNKIISMLLNDDIISLQKLAQDPLFSSDDVITLEENSYFFEPHFQTKIINLAAYFGAIKCFKFLLLNGARLFPSGNYQINESESIENMAILGGNLEIVEIIYSLGFSSFSLSTATLAHQNDIFFWIIEHGFNQSENYIPVLYAAAISNNLPIIIYCLKQGDDINSSPFNPLGAAVKSGNIEAVELLLTRRRLDVNITFQTFTPYEIAQRNNDKILEEIIKSHPSFHRVLKKIK